MKRSSLFLFAALACTFSLAACQTSSLTETQRAPVAETTTPFSGEAKEIDAEQSYVSFIGKSNVISHQGKFEAYDAVITLDETDPADLSKASFQAEIDIASVKTDAAGLDGHLQKDDFFAAAAHPKATFVSTSIVNTNENTYDITGDLTIKGVTKSVTINAEITDNYLLAVYDLPRKEFGIGNDSYGNKLLEDVVPVEVKLVFKR